jgi:hypothetical protein
MFRVLSCTATRAERTLASVTAMLVEVQVVELYDGAASEQEVDEFLTKRGFERADIATTSSATSTARSSVGRSAVFAPIEQDVIVQSRYIPWKGFFG